MRTRGLARMSVAVALASSAWSAETRVYRAQHRPVAELASLAEAALGDEGHVAVDARTASLIMVGQPAALDRAVALLKIQDRPADTLIVEYRLERRGALAARSVRVDWAIEAGSFRIGRVRVSGSGLRAALGASEARSDATLSGSLRLVSGARGTIVTGDAIPLPARSPRASTSGYVSAGSGFEVRATVLGSGHVALELRPFEGRLVAGGVRYLAVATELIVTPGETVVLGSIAREAEDRQTDRLGRFATREASEEQLLLVSVAVAEPSRP